MVKSSLKPTSDLHFSLQRLEQRHRALAAELAEIGLVLRGSIGHRLARCGQPACRCKADAPELHGPYYVWTRKIAGKTVTAQLKPESAQYCLAWSQNMRKLDRIVKEMQDLGLQAAQLVRGQPTGARSLLRPARKS